MGSDGNMAHSELSSGIPIYNDSVVDDALKATVYNCVLVEMCWREYLNMDTYSFYKPRSLNSRENVTVYLVLTPNQS